MLLDKSWFSGKIYDKIDCMNEYRWEKINISRRLELLAEFLPPVDTVCDIGADHAWLLIRLVQKDKVRRGIGVEITAGPYRRAQKNIQDHGLNDRLEVRLGDGLGPIRPGEAQGAVIAGMGGGTISGILERSPQVTAKLEYFLLQPMNQPDLVRKSLQRLGFGIIREAMIEERQILYPVILAAPGGMPPLSPQEARFGPLLMKSRPPELLVEIRRQLEAWHRVEKGLARSGLAASRKKEAVIREKIRELEELIQCLYPAEE